MAGVQKHAPGCQCCATCSCGSYTPPTGVTYGTQVNFYADPWTSQFVNETCYLTSKTGLTSFSNNAQGCPVASQQLSINRSASGYVWCVLRDSSSIISYINNFRVSCQNNSLKLIMYSTQQDTDFGNAYYSTPDTTSPLHVKWEGNPYRWFYGTINGIYTNCVNNAEYVSVFENVSTAYTYYYNQADSVIPTIARNNPNCPQCPTPKFGLVKYQIYEYITVNCCADAVSRVLSFSDTSSRGTLTGNLTFQTISLTNSSGHNGTTQSLSGWIGYFNFTGIDGALGSGVCTPATVDTSVLVRLACGGTTAQNFYLELYHEFCGSNGKTGAHTATPDFYEWHLLNPTQNSASCSPVNFSFSWTESWVPTGQGPISHTTTITS